MHTDNAGDHSRLDHILLHQGKDACAGALTAAVRRNRQSGLSLLRQESLSYPCFLVLLPAVRTLSLLPDLNQKLRIAANITGRLQDPERTGGINPLKGKSPSVRHALRWMLETGSKREEEADLRYLLDSVAALLLHTYGDTQSLATIANIILRRTAAGYNTHYLVWAYFSTGNPMALETMAGHLTGEHHKTAAALLGVAEDTAYDTYRLWLQENDGYLYFTGESPQYTSSPTPCSIDLLRKYLRRKSDGHLHSPVTPQNKGEANAIAAFHGCNPAEQQALATHSHTVYRNDPELWRLWMRSPLEEQIKSAKGESV